MTEEIRRRMGGFGKYAGGIAAAASTLYGAFATADYAGKWFNQAATAIRELQLVKTELTRHVDEQRDDFRDIKKELGELRQDMTRLLLLSRQPPERVRVAETNQDN